MSTAKPIQDVLPTVLRCVFAPPGNGPRVVYGEDDAGNLVHVLDAAQGIACNLTCPDCGGALIANQGKQKAFHFSHVSRIECDRAGESALHRIAKEIIEESGNLLLPEAGTSGLDGYEIVRPEGPVEFTRVEVEPLQQGFRPDVIGIKEVTRNGQTHVGRLIIEIFVTHKVDEAKLDLLKRNGESAVEIDLSGVDRGITREELAQLLMGDAPRLWLYHRDVAKRNQEISAERQQRLQTWAAMKTRYEASKGIPAHSAGAEEIANAEFDRSLWRLIGLERLLSLPADDSYFDVEPIVWRTTLFSYLAPWHDKRDEIEMHRWAAPLIDAFCEEIHDRAWVKPPFFRDDLLKLDEDTVQFEAWAPAWEEAHKLMQEAYHAISPSHYIGLGMQKICAAVTNGYAEVENLISAIADLFSVLTEYALDLSFHGRIIESEQDILNVLLTLSNRRDQEDAIRFHNEIRTTAETLQSKSYRWDIASWRSLLSSSGLEPRIPGDQGRGAEDRAWTALLERHTKACAELLDQKQAEVTYAVAEAAENITSLFQSNVDRDPYLLTCMKMAGIDFLLSSDVMKDNLLPDPTITPNRITTSFLKRMESEVAVYQSLAGELVRLCNLCAKIADTNLSQRIMEKGCEIVHQGLGSGQSIFLPGLDTSNHVASILRGIGMLSTKSENPKYGEDFAARALFSVPRSLKMSLLETMLYGHVENYRKAIRDIEARNMPPIWVYPGANHGKPY